MERQNFSALLAVQTADGSHTLLNTEHNVHYRSFQGAQAESEYVFLESTALIHHLNTWKVLELGLGVGWNFLVTAKAALEKNINLDYHAIEHWPLPAEILKQVHHKESPLLSFLCHASDVIQTQTTPQTYSFQSISLTIYPMDWAKVVLPTGFKAQAIYHDPFGPKDNPECWTEEAFQKEKEALAPDGRIATYAAAVNVRKAMARSGLYIAIKKGLGTKREMTLAALEQSVLNPHKAIKRNKYL